MKPKNVFIALTHYYRPSKTAVGRFNVEEECEFLTSLKTRHVANSTFIIDYTKEKVVKTREPAATYDHLLQHVKTKYPDQFKELLDIMN